MFKITPFRNIRFLGPLLEASLAHFGLFWTPNCDTNVNRNGTKSVAKNGSLQNLILDPALDPEMVPKTSRVPARVEPKNLV